MIPENEERKFLHDLVGALAVAVFSAEILVDTLTEDSGPPKLIDTAKKVTKALEKCKELVMKRREVLLRERVDPS